MKTDRDLRASERPADDQTDQIDDAESSADVGEHNRATNSDDLDAVAQRAPSTAARPASCFLTMFLTKSTTLNRMQMSTAAAEQPAAIRAIRECVNSLFFVGTVFFFQREKRKV